MKFKSFGLRELGVVIVLITVVMTVMLLSFVDSLISASQESCTCGDVCGMVAYETPLIAYAGVLALSVLFFIGVALLVKGGKLVGGEGGKAAWNEKLKTLEEDEKKIYKLIMDAGGAIFQSELVEKTGLSKVKVSRTLDKLESRRLLERRRRGLTNIIVLKQ